MIPFYKPDVGELEAEAVKRVLLSGGLSYGDEARRFEADLSRQLGGIPALATTSCSAALHLALHALGVGPGDVVILPSLTFAATAHAVMNVGAIPVFLDVDAGDLDQSPLCLSPVEVRKALTLEGHVETRDVGAPMSEELFRQFWRSRVKAVIAVHYAGIPAQVEKLRAICDEFKIALVEDCAHAMGTYFDDGREAGTVGDVGCFSFYATKNATTGDGGALVTQSPRIMARARQAALHGFDDGTDSPVVGPGWKLRMPDVLAAIGRVQLQRLDGLQSERQRVAARYMNRLPLHLIERVGLEGRGIFGGQSHHLNVVRVQERERVRRHLLERGVHTSVHWKPLHLHPYFDRCPRGPLPVTEHAGREVLSLPLYPSMTQRDVDYVCDALLEAVR